MSWALYIPACCTIQLLLLLLQPTTHRVRASKRHDRDLWGEDQRGGKHAANGAKIGDGDSSALQLLRGQPRLLGSSLGEGQQGVVMRLCYLSYCWSCSSC